MSEKGSALRFQRANYVVSDLGRALGFYCDILGFTVEFQKVSEPDSYSYPVFEIDRSADMRFAVLSAPDQPRVMALTEVTGVELADSLFRDVRPLFWMLLILMAW